MASLTSYRFPSDGFAADSSMLAVQTSSNNKYTLPLTHGRRPSLERKAAPARGQLHPLRRQQRTLSQDGWQHRWLPAVHWRLVALCGCWYVSSVVSSSSSKMILRQFTFPVTMSIVQFVMNLFYCLVTVVSVRRLERALFSSSSPHDHHRGSLLESFPKGTFPAELGSFDYSVARDFFRPSALLLKATVPMGVFQFVGQIVNNKATSVIPVSLVHTIKALSPITTVLIYRLLFKKHFGSRTYLTLIPVVSGVMLSCLKPGKMNHSEDALYRTGCVFAFVSMLIFVSQNIFAKKFLTYQSSQSNSASLKNALEMELKKSNTQEASPILPISFAQRNASGLSTPLYGNASQSGNKLVRDSEGLDKMSVLFYCSVVGLSLTLPIYLLSELTNPVLSVSLITPHILSLMLVYGLAHFLQSILAFQILGLVSPINYSIANILKRITVITVSIAIEGTHLCTLQYLGLVLTFGGLYAYDRWGSSAGHNNIIIV